MPPYGGRKHPNQELIQIDTTDVLFICGGAFEGLDKTIARRVEERTMGFAADIKSRKERNIGEILTHIQPTDLLSFGLIPEFIGRLPIVATLHDLDEAAMVDILTKPKNAIAKQYQKMFRLENVELSIEPEAYLAIAREAIKRNTGARGLRTIIEELMLDVMYDIPSIENVDRVTLDAECVTAKKRPAVHTRPAKPKEIKDIEEAKKSKEKIKEAKKSEEKDKEVA